MPVFAVVVFTSGILCCLPIRAYGHRVTSDVLYCTVCRPKQEPRLHCFTMSSHRAPRSLRLTRHGTPRPLRLTRHEAPHPRRLTRHEAPRSLRLTMHYYTLPPSVHGGMVLAYWRSCETGSSKRLQTPHRIPALASSSVTRARYVGSGYPKQLVPPQGLVYLRVNVSRKPPSPGRHYHR